MEENCVQGRTGGEPIALFVCPDFAALCRLELRCVKRSEQSL